MPDNVYPPFPDDVGGSMSPRQLNRWLDVSPQGGALKRIEGYLTIPIFSQTVDWKGYSEIVLSYNFACDRNFVLIDFDTAFPVNTNYAMFIAYQQDGVVYRYKLYGADGVFYFTTTPYNGQTIKKSFRLEVWSVADADVTQSSAIQFYTSVRGSFDYRFASDFELGTNAGEVTDFQNESVTVDLPFQSDLMFAFRADSGYDRIAGVWTSRFPDATQLTCTAPGQIPATSSLINGHSYLPLTQAKPWSASISADCYNLFFLFRAELTVSTGAVVELLSSGFPILSVNLGASTAPSTNPTNMIGENDVGVYSTVSSQLSNGFYLVEMRSEFLFKYLINGSEAVATGTGSINANQSVDQLRLAFGRGIDLVEVWAYQGQQNFNTAPDYYQLFKYISDRYGIGRIPLPITFSSNAVVPNNI